MIYCIDPTADEPILLINKHIGYDDIDGQGIDGALFQQELLQLDTLGKKRIQVWINSCGGNVMDGYNIYSAILKTNTPVDTVAVGGVASIAAVIFQAGRKRIMTDYSWLMYHNPFGSDNKEAIKTFKESIVKMISQRCKMSENEVDAMMNKDSYISSKECLTMGLCDSIDESKNENTKYLKKITNNVDFHKECNKILNSILTPTKKTIEMIKVTMKLGLNDSAPEDSIVKAIEAIENKAVKAEQGRLEAITAMENKAKADSDEMENLKAKFEKLKADKEKNDADLEDCKSKIAAIEKDKAKIEDEAKLDKAKNMIEGFAKVGRIKNEETVKLQWVNLAKVDFEGTKNMIEALPLNKVSEGVKDVINKVETPTTAVSLAAKLREQRNK